MPKEKTRRADLLHVEAEQFYQAWDLLQTIIHKEDSIIYRECVESLSLFQDLVLCSCDWFLVLEKIVTESFSKWYLNMNIVNAATVGV